MEGQLIRGVHTKDLQTQGKDLPRVIEQLFVVLEELNIYTPTLVLVEKQLGKFSFAQIESAVYMYFKLRSVPVRQMNPRHKLQAKVDNIQMPKEKDDFAKKYDFNKYLAKQMLDAFLANTH